MQTNIVANNANFDYSILDNETAVFLNEKEKAIKTIVIESATEIGHAIEPSISRINVRKLLVYARVIQNNEKDVIPTQWYLNNGTVEKAAFKRRTMFNNGQYGYMWVFNIKLVWKKIMESMQKDGMLNDFNVLKTTKERNDFIRANFSK
jgi:hypothetical protein